MRIVSIITSYTAGGAEVLASNLSGAFVRRGHSSTLVALSAAGSIGNDAESERSLRARVADEGGSARVLDLRDRRNPFAGAAALRRLLRVERPDVIHAHTARAVPMLWLAGARCPIVLTHHNSALSFAPWMFRLFDRVVDRYVAISAECAQLFATHARRPVATIRNAAGSGFMVSRPRDRIGEPATLLAVGALSDQKNYTMLIDAVARLTRMGDPASGVRLWIAGGGALMPQLEAQVASLGMRNTVELLGPRSDIADLMRRADVFVNASHYEGLPIAILEALQSALPVVATHVAGTRELVRDGQNGLLVAPDDPDAFAAALARLLASPDLHRSMSQAALVEGRRYDLDGCATAHLALYEQLHRPPSRPLATSVVPIATI